MEPNIYKADDKKDGIFKKRKLKDKNYLSV